MEGMTDKQFNSYQALVLMSLKRARTEIEASGAKSGELDALITQFERELEKP